MKKVFALLLISSVVIYQGKQIISNPTGAPAGVSGGPAEGGSTCFQGGCHTGSPIATTTALSTNIPANGYTPGTAYTITVNLSGSGRKGFEVSAQKGTGTMMGTFTAGTGTKLLSLGYVTHSAAKSTTTASWTFTWNAPTAGSGAVTFYGAFAVTIGSTFTQQITVQENTGSNKPTVTTTAASSVTSSSADINGIINPNGGNFSCSFQLKTAITPWNFTTLPNAVSGTSNVNVTLPNTGLQPNTQYFYRVCAWLPGDTTWGSTLSFTTNNTGMVENDLMKQVTLFPNPAMNETAFTNLQPGNHWTYSVVSLDGKKHQNETLHADSKIDISAWPQGVYLINITNGELSKTIRLLKQ
jgi:hypothetical protein